MAGPRYKFQGTGFYVLREFGADSPSSVITGITNADPPVVTSAAHGRASGDVIYVQQVAGMTEVNNRAYIIEVINSSSFRLMGNNSTNWGTYTSNGNFDVGVWSELCSTAWSRTGGSKTQIDVTDSCSVAQEFESGLTGPGTVQLSFNYAPNTSTAQVALRAWDESGSTMAVKVVMPSNGGTVVYLGQVLQLSDSANVNGVWLGTANIQLSGFGYHIAAA
jgi:hypothetical protein